MTFLQTFHFPFEKPFYCYDFLFLHNLSSFTLNSEKKINFFHLLPAFLHYSLKLEFFGITFNKSFSKVIKVALEKIGDLSNH
ncbi:hypothetical protein BpHYR1_008422 [Brachionus plicatilis]|uniref:Uncharacterized protein n=1 Tax=Brachionus plicatilis TaxID=10195 RepID=A0A3M7SBE3_BRAPC|nr:hypothetical protein BpHYR1_008422 [Brachionus plicatilis]